MKLKTSIAIALLFVTFAAAAQKKLPSKNDPQTTPPAPTNPAKAVTGPTDVIFSHLDATTDCGGRLVSGSCGLDVEEGALVTLHVVESLPGLLTLKVEKLNKEPDGLKRADFLKLVKSVPGAPAEEDEDQQAAERIGLCRSTCATTFACINHLEDSLASLNRAIQTNLSGYERALCDLTGTVNKIEDLNPNINIRKPEALLGVLTPEQKAEVGEAEFKVFWPKLLRLLAVAPESPANFPRYEATYEDRDFDLKYSFEVASEELDELIDAPEETGTVRVRLRDGWGVTTSTALMVSGLVNDEYTTKSVTTTVDGTDVTKKQAVREDRDVVAPEIAFLVNLARKKLSRDQISVGVGMGTETNGRLYFTWGRRLGQAGAWHIGVAVGKVKRLSQNVNVNDLGDTDPNASRRDVIRPSFTVGLSWRILD